VTERIPERGNFDPAAFAHWLDEFEATKTLCAMLFLGAVHMTASPTSAAGGQERPPRATDREVR